LPTPRGTSEVLDIGSGVLTGLARRESCELEGLVADDLATAQLVVEKGWRSSESRRSPLPPGGVWRVICDVLGEFDLSPGLTGCQPGTPRSTS